MPDPKLAAFEGYDDPLDIADRTDTPYEERLALLQKWKASLPEDAPEAHHAAVAGAIQALEMGAEVQGDTPDAAPDAHGYGVQKPQ